MRTLTAVVLVASILVAPGVAGAETNGAEAPWPGNAASHADFDHDRISDALEARLAAADPQELIDVVVTWDGRVDEASAHAAAGPFSVNRRFTIIDGFSATMRAAQIRALAGTPGVFRVEQDFQVTVLNDDADTTIGTDLARTDFGVDGTGVLACVLDTGADPGHEQLDGSKITHWNDFIGTGQAPYDDHGHGTHVAASLAGEGTGSANAQQLAGIAPGASLAIGKVLDGNGSGAESGIIAAIEWCVSIGADLGSMSLGTTGGSDGNDALSQAVDAAANDHGVPFIVAAGNSGDDFYTVGSPGAARAALTIGAGADTEAGLRLAYFSSRGPTLDGRNKPDLVAPGMGIDSADAGTKSGYVAMSGTSMATPIAAGTVALALELDPTLTPAALKAAITSTALDLGPSGPDPDWGAGYLDGHAFLASIAGTSGGAGFPQIETTQGAVADSGLWTHTFTITSEQLADPISATILIEGASECVWELLPGLCWAAEWSPDLDARLLDPSGSQVSVSTCPAGTECATTGHQEILRANPTTAGTYTIEVWPYAGSPNDGTGGSFTIDLATGSAGAPPPQGLPPDAIDDTHGTNEDETLVVTSPGVLGNDSDPDGDSLTVASHTQPANGSVAVGADGGFTYTPDADFAGFDSFEYTASDGNGGTDVATVYLTVDAVNDAPVADAGPDQTVVDTDGDGMESVLLDGTGSFDIDGAIASWTWAEGATPLGTGPSPTVDLAEGIHTITLTVTDGDGAADSDTVVISVNAFTGDTVHVADIDSSEKTWRNGNWRTKLELLVHQSDHSPVSGASVTLSADTGDLLTCQTNGQGMCAIQTDQFPAGTASVTFTVIGIETPEGTYAEGDNHDPDGDSDGTTIVASPA